MPTRCLNLPAFLLVAVATVGGLALLTPTAVQAAQGEVCLVELGDSSGALIAIDDGGQDSYPVGLNQEVGLVFRVEDTSDELAVEVTLDSETGSGRLLSRAEIVGHEADVPNVAHSVLAPPVGFVTVQTIPTAPFNDADGLPLDSIDAWLADSGWSEFANDAASVCGGTDADGWGFVSFSCIATGVFQIDIFAPEDTAETAATERFLCDDGDGIESGIDTDPSAASDSFSDGVTSGSILTRGDQELTITDEPAPLGVRIAAAASGGATPALIAACGSSEYNLTPGDEIVVTCGSSIVQVIVGPVEVEFFEEGVSAGTTTLQTGANLTFDDDTLVFTNNGTNPVVVVVNGQELTVGPGESIATPAASNPPVSKDDCKRGGWQELTRHDGTPFRNQGACVSYAVQNP